MSNEHKPYIFVSYSHKDTATVIPIIENLKQHGFGVWYDNGIEAGSEWPEYIAERLMDSTVVLAFMSQNALNSHNCRREINFAIEIRKELLVIYLEDLNLTPGMRMQLNTLQAIYFTRFNNMQSFMEALYNAKILEACKGTPPKIEKPDKAAPIDKVEMPSAKVTAPAPETTAPSQKAEEEIGKNSPVVYQNFDRLRASAEANEPTAQYLLSLCCQKGLYCTANYEQAIQWMGKAADSLIIAQYALACLLEYGRKDYATAEDPDKAAALFRISANAGHIWAQNDYACCLRKNGKNKNVAESVKWLWASAAPQANAQSNPILEQYLVAAEASKELKLICTDTAATAERYKNDINNGYFHSQWGMATLLQKGEHVTQDLNKAFEYYSLCAEAGHFGAQFELAFCYDKGLGVKQDSGQAEHWYKLAETNPGNKQPITRDYYLSVFKKSTVLKLQQMNII